MKELIINGQEIGQGTTHLDLPAIKLYTDTDIQIPVTVKRAKNPGPTVFVSAAIHGDEINGIEIVRRLIQMPSLKLLRGTLILVPIVNVHGVLSRSRYMPDRRDLNRSFPGSPRGSLAGRVADRFVKEIVHQCDYGIDLHTGAIHRSNYPQIRANLEDQETRALAEAFGVPVLINANIRDGSLREAAVDAGARVLLYEAGEALRFDELSILAGVRGVLNVLGDLGVIRKRRKRKLVTPFISNHTAWVRADSSGIVRDLKALGDAVQKGDVLAEIGSPRGEILGRITAHRAGVIIGKQNIPLVQEGDAMFHLAFFTEEDEKVVESIEILEDTLLPDEMA